MAVLLHCMSSNLELIQCWPLSLGAHDQLLAPAVEERRGADEERAGALSSVGAGEVAFGIGAQQPL